MSDDDWSDDSKGMVDFPDTPNDKLIGSVRRLT
jgi:hypothetical protein